MRSDRINESSGNYGEVNQKIVNVDVATYSVLAADSGTIYTLNRAAGIAITLPAAEAGLVYEFHVGTTFTGTFSVTAASSADTYQGVVAIHDKDHLGTVKALNEGIDTDGWNFPAAADYILTMDADTDGRFIGGMIKFQCISESKWLLSGDTFGDGTATHIFS